MLSAKANLGSVGQLKLCDAFVPAELLLFLLLVYAFVRGQSLIIISPKSSSCSHIVMVLLFTDGGGGVDEDGGGDEECTI